MSQTPLTDSTGAHSKNEKPELRFEFVGMMFAVTAGEIGAKFGIMAQNAPAGGPCKFMYALPAICHLLIASLIVASSWVGWSRSRVSLAIRDVVSVFTAPFLVLLIDVLLVVCYFVLVDTVELSADGGKFTVNPSAGGESFWIFMMFIGYFLWDLFTKGFIRPDDEPRAPSSFKRLYALLRRSISRRCWERSWVSLVCVMLGLFAWLIFKDINKYWAVICADAALVALLLLFRALKDLCSAAFLNAGESGVEHRKRRETQTIRRPLTATIVFIILGGTFALGARYQQERAPATIQQGAPTNPAG